MSGQAKRKSESDDDVVVSTGSIALNPDQTHSVEEIRELIRANVEAEAATGAIAIHAVPSEVKITDSEFDEDDKPDVRWVQAPIRKGYGGSALSFAMAGLAASFFVGWAFPLALVGIVLGIIAIRRDEESSELGWWGVGLGCLALVYSAGWLWWAATTLRWFG